MRLWPYIHRQICQDDRLEYDRAMAFIQYSEKYFDNKYEYRHVVLPPDLVRTLPKNRLLSETEWRAIGVKQSLGWVHYAIHQPEPHIMLFRRPLNHHPMPLVPQQNHQPMPLVPQQKKQKKDFAYGAHR